MTVDIEALYLKLPKNIMSFFGVWLPPKRHIILHNIYMLIIMVSQYSFLLFEFIYLFDVLDDLEAASEASYLLFTQASLCYKTTVFLVNKRHLIELLELMRCEMFAPETEVHEKFLSLLAVRIPRLCLFFMTSALTTCTLWAMIPLFDNQGRRSFPFRIWMPVTPERSPQYQLGYLYQVAAIYISAFLFIAVDSVAVCMIMFGCAELDIIMDKVTKLQKVPLSAKLKHTERTELLDKNYKLFVDCIRHHQGVIEFMVKVENNFHANIFFQLSGSVAIICITGLRISIVSPDSVQFFSMCNYMVTMLSQLFLYCWCGHELTIRSEKLREVVYQCPWYQQGTRFKRLLWITMERMKKPIIFKAGHYIPLSRQTFIAILRSSYSYFAVLNQANSK
ncbi:odorant receptor Or1 [Plutella xylostella]|uniref:odorant receptor Or1 n=1 Tax=Plutella xylostella TaxID=51655 RepID=UPI00203264FD|nr:odorant receptor Or1 [Plutella xylostella]